MLPLHSFKIDEFCLNAGESRCIDAVVEHLNMIESVRKGLQESSKKINNAHDMFYAVIIDFLETKDWLKAGANTILSTIFLSAIVKLQRSECFAMERQECITLQ